MLAAGLHAALALVLELAAVAALAWLGWLYLRGGSATAIAGLQRTNRELVRQVGELRERVGVLELENAELRARTDVAGVIAPLAEAVTLHEVNAERRSQAMLGVLGMVAERLGPEAER